MNITGTVGRLNMYKVCWADCYGEERTDYVAVPYHCTSPRYMIDSL